MKKILLVLLVSLFVFSPCYAITWDKLQTPKGRTVYLDLDSIKEHDGYYFYNIKYELSGSILVSTVQSGILRPFSKAIKTYKAKDYEALNGDYDNITSNMTRKLEPVAFESTINTCYKKVKTIYQSKADYITY